MVVVVGVVEDAATMPIRLTASITTYDRFYIASENLQHSVIQDANVWRTTGSDSAESGYLREL